MLHNFKDELEKIQKEIVDVTNLAIVIVDSKGNYVTSKDNYSDFCSIFRKDKILSKLCEKCDKRALKKSKITSEPYIYKCHSGLIDIAVPLIYSGDYIGSILIGQVLLDKDSTFEIDSIIDKNLEKDLRSLAMRDAYRKLSKYNYSKINSIANLVYYSGIYIVKNIKDKKWHSHSMKNNLRNIELSESPIGLAITFIKNNLDKNIKLEEVAFLCSMSVSHFSKIFKSEVGKTFKDYLNAKRIEKAKYLLRESNNPVSTIAYSLGFEDTSYFTKIFKKYVTITPSKYKELFKKNNMITY